MHFRPVHMAFTILIAGLGVTTAVLLAKGVVAPAVLGSALVACLLAWGARAARARRPGDPTASPSGVPKAANVPPDGHIRFTLVVEGRRFRFLKGDPTATAALLKSVLGAAAGVPVRTRLEPAAERTPPWS